MTKKEFINNYADESVRQRIRNAAIGSYICLIISTLIMLYIRSIAGFVFIAICLALTLGFHLNRSKGCAIALLVIAVCDCVVAIILLGSVSSIIIIISGILAVRAFAIADKQYEEYQYQEGTYRLPDEMFE